MADDVPPWVDRLHKAINQRIADNAVYIHTTTTLHPKAKPIGTASKVFATQEGADARGAAANALDPKGSLKQYRKDI